MFRFSAEPERRNKLRASERPTRRTAQTGNTSSRRSSTAVWGHGRRTVSVQRGSNRAEKVQQEGGQRSEVTAHGQQGLGGRQGERAASVRLELADYSTKGREKIFHAFLWKHTGTSSGN